MVAIFSVENDISVSWAAYEDLIPGIQKLADYIIRILENSLDAIEEEEFFNDLKVDLAVAKKDITFLSGKQNCSLSILA